jgi:SpoVK/Ycf46/Vps4 family AAA+-type ATPase
MANNEFYKKAYKLVEVDTAVRFDVPIGSDHEFFTDFSDVRGDFEDRMIYKALKVNPSTFIYNDLANRGNKTLLFLAGMRGSGKTSELAKIAQKLNHPNGFFCVTCNLDEGLDLNDMEYMDIVIFQMERLFEELERIKLAIDVTIIASLQNWFSERVQEVNKAIKRDDGFEVEMSAGVPSFLSFIGLTAKVKANLLGSKENAQKIRTVFKNNFTDFAIQFNLFIEEVNVMLRRTQTAKELLFVVDGIEKAASLDIRKKIILEEANRIRLVKTNTIFTLPIELMPERQKLISFSTVVSFPFVKIREKNGDVVENAVQRFMEFTYKRIDSKLFDSEETVRKAILMGGGSPREYLRILEYANMFANDDDQVITSEALEKGIRKLAAETSQYVSTADLEKLKTLKQSNEEGKVMPFDADWQDLLEKLIILEYNDGTYKRVNPIVEESQLYKQYVG